MELAGQSKQAPRVLVVEDDPGLRMLTVEAVEGLNLTVDEAADGLEALERFRECPADLVLLDVRMPRMDGFTACEELLALDSNQQTTIVMVTGLDDHDSIRRAYQLGATDFITKPINWTILPERVLFLLRARETFQALRKSEARLKEAQRIASLGYWEWSIKEDKLLWSDQVFRMFGVDTEHFSPSFEGFMNKVHPDDRNAVRAAVNDALVHEAPYTLDHRIVQPNGEERVVHSQAEVQRDGANAPQCMLGTILDITERKNAEARIHQLSYYDSLTGLPNRHLFREFAEHALPTARRQNSCLALLHIDIDRFSRLNDTLGRDAGDLLLRGIAKRISRSIRGSDMAAKSDADYLESYSLARLGADEFLVMLTGLTRPEHAGQAAKRLLSDLSRPMQASHGDYLPTASIGIAVFPNDCNDLDALMRHADTSLHFVKKNGGNGFRFYASDMEDRSNRRLTREAQLHWGLERDEFELHYQPQTRISDGRLVGLEALIRWRRPDEGLVSPADFIPLAEQTGLIVPIGEWVIQEACRQIAHWQQAGMPPVPVAVNLSARQFAESTLAQTISRALAGHHLDPSLLEIELTESLIMDDAETAREKLWAFHETGLKIAVDDFGTGYSSMNYLKRFPLDTLKIDRSFVCDIDISSTDAAIVRAIVALGQALELTTLAEGVETQSQFDALARTGCDRVQGFLLGRPVPAKLIFP